MEFWLARDLGPVLGYEKYDNFAQVMRKARIACVQSGMEEADHFANVGRMVDIGSGARREIADVRLSRYACYLVVQNGDPSRRGVRKFRTIRRSGPCPRRGAV